MGHKGRRKQKHSRSALRPFVKASPEVLPKSLSLPHRVEAPHRAPRERPAPDSWQSPWHSNTRGQKELIPNALHHAATLNGPYGSCVLLNTAGNSIIQSEASSLKGRREMPFDRTLSSPTQRLENLHQLHHQGVEQSGNRGAIARTETTKAPMHKLSGHPGAAVLHRYGGSVQTFGSYAQLPKVCTDPPYKGQPSGPL